MSRCNPKSVAAASSDPQLLADDWVVVTDPNPVENIDSSHTRVSRKEHRKTLMQDLATDMAARVEQSAIYEALHEERKNIFENDKKFSDVDPSRFAPDEQFNSMMEEFKPEYKLGSTVALCDISTAFLASSSSSCTTNFPQNQRVVDRWKAVVTGYIVQRKRAEGEKWYRRMRYGIGLARREKPLEVFVRRGTNYHQPVKDQWQLGFLFHLNLDMDTADVRIGGKMTTVMMACVKVAQEVKSREPTEFEYHAGWILGYFQPGACSPCKSQKRVKGKKERYTPIGHSY